MGCSTEVQEAFKIADLTKIPTEFKTINDREEIDQIHEIAGRLVWVEEAIETTGDPDYSFWLEREGEELRITNYEVWINGEDSVVIDHVNIKFAHIKGVDLQELKNRLEAPFKSN